MEGQRPIPCRPWDSTLWLEQQRIEESILPGESFDDVRCRVRIDAPERAMEEARATPFAALTPLHDDLEKRRARWAHLHALRCRRRWRVSWHRLIGGLALSLVVTIAWIALFSFFGIFGILLVIPFLAAGSDREAPVFDMSLCPSCAYDLHAVPDAIPEDRLGLRSGPRACPECGAAWPLVPPPA